MRRLRPLSIRVWLILLVLAVVLPAAGLVAWYIDADSREARDGAYASVKRLAERTGADLGQLLRDDKQLLERLAARPLVRALDASKCDPLVGEYARLHPEFTTLVVRDVAGNSVCSFLPNSAKRVGGSEFPWFEEGIRSGEFHVGDAYLGYLSGRWVSVLTHPVRDELGRVSGLLVLPVELYGLGERLLHFVPGSAFVAVIDGQNKILFRSIDPAAWVGKALPGLPAETLRGSGDGFFSTDGVDGVQRLYAVATVPGTGWRVLAGVPEDEVFAAHRARLTRSIAIGLAALLLALALSYRIAAAIVKPVRRLAKTSARIANGDLDARARIAGPAEVEYVARQFNHMLDVRAQAEEALRASEERLHGIVHMAAEAIIVVDEQFRVVLFNPTAEAVFGCSAADAFGASAERFVPPRLRDACYQHMAAFVAGGANAIRMGDHVEIFGLRADGEEFPLEISLSRISHSGKPLYSVVLNDISARRRDEARLNALANYDALTALPNRALFHKRVQRSLVHAQRFNEGLAVLFLDLDRFKIVNDTLGHSVGDRVLQALAGRLKDCLREVDTLARLGGDEFAVLIEQVTDTRFVGSVARKLLKAVAEPLTLDGQEYNITASIGISAYPADGSEAATLLKNADIALYRAKERGKNNAQFYAADMNAHSMARLSLETGLRRALERGEFLLHYQPKLDIGTGRICGMEALVRWMRPESGMVSPAEFIPLAEETGLIEPIGAWVLKAACERNRAWQREGMPAMRVAVNLSARQFVQANLVSDVARVLDETGLAPGSLELEITESMVMDDPERAIRTLRQLKSMGIALAIDDFGTGYSSLGYLKRFPIDNIKIDRSFIKDIPGNSDDATITRTIIDMTHNLRLKVVAEGVETKAQLDFLREQGCDEMQGYYFSRPLAEDAFLKLVQAQQYKAAIAA
ncbi:MAG: EAL domain-containing protein [Burkholderiales bacterium]|nr:EAL domain-containing protein [Burkholderiales bacterium]